MTINDILALGKMGFSAQQVQQMLSLERAKPSDYWMPASSERTPISAPAAAPATQQPVTPDPMAAMAQQIADLTAAINAKSVPTAGTVGNPAPVTSVEDIILGLVQPAEAPASPDFSAVK